MKPSDIDQVLLVGRQTQLPAVKVALRDRYDWTINDSVNPDEAVARGVAVLGASWVTKTIQNVSRSHDCSVRSRSHNLLVIAQEEYKGIKNRCNAHAAIVLVD